MNVAGQRVLIVGDSLSHPGMDAAPTVQDVTQGSQRNSSAPGDLLGSLALEHGAEAVRIDAKVGRSAISFLSNEPAAQLIAQDAAWRPTRVIVMLGTNDAERDLAKTEAAMTQIRDAYRAMGAEVYAIGPMTYLGRGAVLNAPAARVYDVMQRAFGPRLVDARPLTADFDASLRSGDGIHFNAAGARMLAPRLFDGLGQLDKAIGTLRRPAVSIAIGFGAVIALGLVVWAIRRRSMLGQVPGGKARGLAPSQFDSTQLKIGQRVEFEHTSDPVVAQKIAMDHLVEDPAYYQKLRLVHKD